MSFIQILKNIYGKIADVVTGTIGKALVKIGVTGEKLVKLSKKRHRAQTKQLMKEAAGMKQVEALKFLREGGATEEELKEGTERL